MGHREVPCHWLPAWDVLKDRWRMKSLVVISALLFSVLGHSAMMAVRTWRLSSSTSQHWQSQEVVNSKAEEKGKKDAQSSFCQLKQEMCFSWDKTSQLIEVHSYCVSPKDTGRSCRELERPSDEAVICNFHLPAKERGMWDCKCCPKAPNKKRSTLYSMHYHGIWPSHAAYIYEVWRGNRSIGESRVKFIVRVQAFFSAWTDQVQHSARLLSAAAAIHMSEMSHSCVGLICRFLL